MAGSGGSAGEGDETDPGVVDSIGYVAKFEGGQHRFGYSLAHDSRIERCQAVLRGGLAMSLIRWEILMSVAGDSGAEGERPSVRFGSGGTEAGRPAKTRRKKVPAEWVWPLGPRASNE